MAIPTTPQPVASRSVIEFTVGKPTDFPQSTSSRAFGIPSQSYIPNYGTPSNALLMYDQVRAIMTIPANAFGALSQTSITATVTFPNLQFPFITGNSEEVYCIPSCDWQDSSVQFIPGQTTLSLSYTLQQQNGNPITVTPGFELTGQMQGSVQSVGRVLPLPVSSTITGITLNIGKAYYNQVNSPAAGIGIVVCSVLVVVNTGFVSQLAL